MKKIELKTKRLVLRPLKILDVKGIVENVNDFEVSKWLLVVPYPYAIKDAKEWIKNTQETWRKREKESYTFGIELKSEKKVIGGIGLHHVDTYSGYAEIGYWLGAKYHKKGYGSEALGAMIDFSFNKLKLRRLEAGVFTENPSSGKLLEKFGFKKEGVRIQARRCKADGRIVDETMYALVKESSKN
jgi:RimJ/RimL family protein N-acetyltransferase